MFVVSSRSWVVRHVGSMLVSVCRVLLKDVQLVMSNVLDNFFIFSFVWIGQ